MTMQTAKEFFEETVIVIWNFNGKIRSIINQARNVELVVSLILHQRCFPRETQVQPSVADDDHLWSLQ